MEINPVNNAPCTPPESHRRPKAAAILKKAAQWLIPLALTILLVHYLFRKVDFREMMHIISHGVSYGWILLAMVLSIFSHIIRATRWRMQLRALGIDPPFMALCCSIFGCYALNLIFPRLGEVWRCSYISSVASDKKKRAPFTTIFGSMMADRLSDTLSVLLITLFTFCVASSSIIAFLDKYPIGRELISLLASPMLWLGIIFGCAAIFALFRLCRNTRPIRKLRAWGSELWYGFASVAAMPERGRFLLLTLLLWGCYYTQLYVAFYAFPFTRALCAEPSLGFGLVPCLVAFVLSAIGMAVPSNGGLGPWNIAVMFGLSIYGISDAQGTAFSMLQWSGQTVMLIILGLFTLGYILLTQHQKKAERQ